MEEQDTSEIQTEEIAQESVLSKEDQDKKKRKEEIFELVLFFILGILIGVTIKTEAARKITIGFEDYKISRPAASYDVTAIKKQLDDQVAQQQAQAQQSASPTDGQQPAQPQAQAPAVQQ